MLSRPGASLESAAVVVATVALLAVAALPAGATPVAAGATPTAAPKQGAVRRPPAKVPTAKRPAPAKPAKKPTPAQMRAADLRAGAALFAANGCGACHLLAGAHAAGTAGPNLDVLGLPAAEIVAQLTRGSISMPSFRKRLTAGQIAQLAGYVAATAQARATRPRDAATLFRGYCGTCHALAVAGTGGAGAPTLDGRATTAAAVRSAVVTQHPVALGFGLHLEPAELQAIADYVAAAGPREADPPPAATAAAAG